MASPTPTVNPTILREYIGSKPYPDNFDDIPDIINPVIKEFHFIIAFASEEYDESRKGTGKFVANWHVPPINGEMIRKLKKKCDNVKVVISIGGHGPTYPFNPAENEEIWFRNARDSLTMIINELKAQGGNDVIIDGIDINYDTIIVNPNDVEDVFAKYIGRLITTLKTVVINVVSIAPSQSVQPHYEALYQHNRNAIDWVNYKFYTHSIHSADEFEEVYRTPARVYGHKLVAGFSTDPHDAGKLPRDVFLKACADRIKSGELRGIFIWNANDSASNAAPFLMEGYAQNLILITQN